MKIFTNVGSSVINFLRETGRFFIFTLKTLKSSISKRYFKNIFQQMVSIGYLSLPVVSEFTLAAQTRAARDAARKCARARAARSACSPSALRLAVVAHGSTS